MRFFKTRVIAGEYAINKLTVSCCGEAAQERLKNYLVEAPECPRTKGLIGCLLKFRLIATFAKACV